MEEKDGEHDDDEEEEDEKDDDDDEAEKDDEADEDAEDSLAAEAFRSRLRKRPIDLSYCMRLSGVLSAV